MKRSLVNHLKQIDYSIVLMTVLLSGFGLLMIYSSSYAYGYLVYESPNHFFNRQLQWLVIGFILFLLAAFFPYKYYQKLAPFLVLLSVILLGLVFIPGLGVERNYSQRWIEIGPLQFQPTEAIKLFMIIYFASFYSKGEEKLDSFKKGIMPPFIILTVIFLFILMQPDLGTAVLLLGACGLIVLCSGVKYRHLLMLGGAGLTLVIYFAFSQAYRLERITSFTAPFADAAGSGYQLVNSYVAIGTGGLLGNGLGNSVQKLGFLPEAHTDFIMAIIIEELGIIGLLFIICIFIYVMVRGVAIAKANTDRFAKLLAIGITFQLMMQVIINLGAVSGLLPVTGVPLPLISYGGSSLLMTMISLGVLTNISGYRLREKRT